MGLEECHFITVSLPLIGKKIQRQNGCHEDAEIGHCKGNQVGVHDSSQVWPREDNQAEDVPQDAYSNNDIGNYAVGDVVDARNRKFYAGHFWRDVRAGVAHVE